MGKGKRIRATLRGKDPMRNMLALMQKIDQDAWLVSKADRAAQFVELHYCTDDQDDFDSDEYHMRGMGIDLDRAWADQQRRDGIREDGIALAVSSGWL